MKTKYRVNWGNGQVQSVSSKAAGLRLIKGDLYEKFARIQFFDGYEWHTIKGASND